MPASLPARVVVPPDVLSQELDGETVLVDLRRGSQATYVLDDIGTRVWTLLAEHGDVATVVRELLDMYDVDEATLRQHLADLITKLVGARLVTVDPE